MNRYFLFLCVSILVIFFSFSDIFAQFYVGPIVGFKSSGLKGVGTVTAGGQVVNRFGNEDAGSTGFNAGVAVGYQVIPPDVAGGLYKLDINLDVSWASFSYFENGYNSANGSGAFSADGLSGGKTNVISLDVMPIHRFHFKHFILSPYAGIGLGINLMFNGDVTASGYKITGNTETKLGLLIFYGTLFNLTENIQPFIQFKHLLPFGSESTFTKSIEATGGGSENIAFNIADVPGYFNLVAGVRFNF